MRGPLRRAPIALALPLLACVGGTETGNPVLSTPIALSIHTSEPERIAVAAGAPGSAITEAWVAFGEARFLGADECARFGDLTAPAGTQLMADLAQPGAALTLSAQSAQRCGLLLPLQTDGTEPPDAAPPTLRGRSVLVRGRRADATAFELAYGERDELELAVEGGTFDPTAQPLVLSFDVAAWLRDVDLDAATLEPDGAILIDADHNRSLLDRFELNLACSAELYADQDEDGRVSKGEPLLARCAPDGT